MVSSGRRTQLPLEDHVALARRRLCLPPSMDQDVEAALRALGEQPRDLVTLSWTGRPASAGDEKSSR